MEPMDKLRKKAIAEQQKRMKPGECLKYMKTIIDPDVLSHRFGTQVLAQLNALSVTVVVESQSVGGTVHWKRTVQQELIGIDGQLSISDQEIDEHFVLLVWQATELTDAIRNEQLLDRIKAVQLQYSPRKTITLLVCGPTQTNDIALQTHLTELQLFANVNYRFIETAADLANTILHYTKSVAEIPYKKQISEKLMDQNFYATNDNKDCVTVKEMVGLSKLWQHHLFKMPSVTLETAEAIISAYPMPRLLIDAYKTSDNGADLLTNIPVRRSGGPLQSVRKVGPEISRRLYALYTNNDPEHIL